MTSCTASLRRMPALLALALVVSLGVGCSSAPSRTAGSGGGAGGWFGGLFGSGLSPALEAQRERLVDALRGTPVVVEATADKRLRVQVPVRYAFDAGRSAVKPPLGAVLEQFAIGFKPRAATTELHIAAPADGGKGPTLVQPRAASVRDYLLAQGVPASRVAGLGRADGAALEILVSDRPLNK